MKKVVNILGRIQFGDRKNDVENYSLTESSE
jgi:hypothetical protein